MHAITVLVKTLDRVRYKIRWCIMLPFIASHKSKFSCFTVYYKLAHLAAYCFIKVCTKVLLCVWFLLMSELYLRLEKFDDG